MASHILVKMEKTDQPKSQLCPHSLQCGIAGGKWLTIEYMGQSQTDSQNVK